MSDQESRKPRESQPREADPTVKCSPGPVDLPPAPPASSSLMVFMFTDVADSTRMKQPGALGAAAYAELARRHDTLFRSIVGDIDGADILKDIGDGFMAIFPTASDAVRAALRFQFALSSDAAFATANAQLPFRVRIGIHQGEVSVLDLDIHNKPKLIGPAADMTARIQSLALPGQILVSRAAFNDARQYVREHPVCGEAAACPLLHWDAHGHYRFKGVDDSQEVFEVGAEGLAPRTAPPDTEKARYVGSPDDEVMRGWRPAAGQLIPGRQNWSLEKRLGEGGFGEAWLAHHVKTRERRVFKFCFDIERLRSFRREITIFRLLREALGDRPDIARLHDFQLDQPPFFLESEYSELGDLAAWAESQGGIDKLPARLRLEIVMLTAEAVAAAHSVGVLHKDIKPSNILMFKAADGSIRPRLADFGIGILTDRAQLEGRGITIAGFSASQLTDNRSSRTGTRMYAPPELDAGKPFTVTGDVYALGVLLYQMAVSDLSRPLATGWEREIDDELLREDISAATMGDPAQRLPSAADLAQRLKMLSDRRSERSTAAEKARREAARKRTVRWAAAGAGVMVVIAGLAIVGYVRERDLRDAEKRAKDEAIKQKDTAVAAQESEERERKKSDSINQFIQSALKSSDPNQGGKQDMLVTDAMTRAIEELDGGSFKDQPEVEADLRLTIAQILNGNGHSTEALPQAERALEILERLYPGDHADVARALNHLGHMLFDLGRAADAEPLNQQALEMRQRLFKGDHPDVAESLGSLASVRQVLGRGAEAEPLCQQALEMRQRIFEGDHPDVARSLNNLASVRQALGRSAEAEPLYQQALEMNQRLFKGDHPDVAKGLNNLASVRQALGRAAEAEPLYQQALEMRQRLFKGDHQSVALALNNLAFVRQALGRAAEAEPLFQQALEMKQRLFKGDHPSVAVSLNNLASARKDLGRAAEAEPLYQQALEMRQRLFKGGHPEVATSLNNLAGVRRDLGRVAEAEPLYQQALEMRQRLFKGNHPDVAQSLRNLAGVREELGRAAEAEPLLRECLAMRERLFPDGDARAWMRYDTMSLLGETVASQGRFAEAEPLLQTGYAGLRDDPRVPAPTLVRGSNYKRDALERLVKLYDAWHTAEPGKGYDAKAAEWRAKLETLQATPGAAAPAANPDQPTAPSLPVASQP